MSPPPGPVFVVGCPRSGTTLLYHTLISAGGFVDYPAETHVFNLFAPRFGSLAKRRTRERFFDAWIKTAYFTKTGLDGEKTRRELGERARNWGDFLRIVMEGMAEAQGVHRWAECTPHHALHLEEIARFIPDARIVHIIRDGRDVALSMDRLGWAPRIPGDPNPSLLAAGAYWCWIVHRGKRSGGDCGLPYLEVRFEDLVRNPKDTLGRLSAFIEQDLDYDEIQRNAVGSVAKPNSSFGNPGKPGDFDPVDRWRERMSPELQKSFHSNFGAILGELGYGPTSDGPPRLGGYGRLYLAFLSTKQWVKSSTPFGRFAVRTVMGDARRGTRDVMKPNA